MTLHTVGVSNLPSSFRSAAGMDGYGMGYLDKQVMNSYSQHPIHHIGIVSRLRMTKNERRVQIPSSRGGARHVQLGHGFVLAGCRCGHCLLAAYPSRKCSIEHPGNTYLAWLARLYPRVLQSGPLVQHPLGSEAAD